MHPYSHSEALEAENAHLRSQLEGLMLPPESRSDSRGLDQSYRGRQDVSPGPRRYVYSHPRLHSLTRRCSDQHLDQLLRTVLPLASSLNPRFLSSLPDYHFLPQQCMLSLRESSSRTSSALEIT